jgi:membrane protein implicated in regulation of membrane protease activity
MTDNKMIAWIGFAFFAAGLAAWSYPWLSISLNVIAFACAMISLALTKGWIVR